MKYYTKLFFLTSTYILFLLSKVECSSGDIKPFADLTSIAASGLRIQIRLARLGQGGERICLKALRSPFTIISNTYLVGSICARICSQIFRIVENGNTTPNTFSIVQGTVNKYFIKADAAATFSRVYNPLSGIVSDPTQGFSFLFLEGTQPIGAVQSVKITSQYDGLADANFNLEYPVSTSQDLPIQFQATNADEWELVEL